MIALLDNRKVHKTLAMISRSAITAFWVCSVMAADFTVTSQKSERKQSADYLRAMNEYYRSVPPYADPNGIVLPPSLKEQAMNRFIDGNPTNVGLPTKWPNQVDLQPQIDFVVKDYLVRYGSKEIQQAADSVQIRERQLLSNLDDSEAQERRFQRPVSVMAFRESGRI